MNTEEETKSKPAEQGDMVVARNDNETPAEQYLVKANKFPKLYETTPIKKLSNGWDIFKSKPEIRNTFVWTNELKEELIKQFTQKEIYSQSEFLKFAKKQKTIKCQKQIFVLGKATQIGEIVITKVVKNTKPISIIFEAPWEETMPLKEGDYIIVMEDEVYRIAKYEFEMTYELL